MLGWILLTFVLGWLSGVVCGVNAMEKKYDKEDK